MLHTRRSVASYNTDIVHKQLLTQLVPVAHAERPAPLRENKSEKEKRGARTENTSSVMLVSDLVCVAYIRDKPHKQHYNSGAHYNISTHYNKWNTEYFVSNQTGERKMSISAKNTRRGSLFGDECC